MKKQTTKCRVPILLYHSISSQPSPRFRKFTISPGLFAEHMLYLKQHDYTPITVTQLAKAIAKTEPALPLQPVILTFDDGFADFYTEALPVLNQYGFPATLYIPTSFVGAANRWLKRNGEAARPMLDWDQLAEISDSGIECGAHSHTHPQLDTLRETCARDEIIRCKTILEEKLGREVASFAYPYGFYTAAVRQMVHRAGYSSACAVRYASSSLADDPFALARFPITSDTKVDDFAALVTGPSPSVAMTFWWARSSVWRCL